MRQERLLAHNFEWRGGGGLPCGHRGREGRGVARRPSHLHPSLPPARRHSQFSHPPIFNEIMFAYSSKLGDI